MTIKILKSQTINGSLHERYTVVSGLPAAQEALLVQGGDAEYVPLNTSTPPVTGIDIGKSNPAAPAWLATGATLAAGQALSARFAQGAVAIAQGAPVALPALVAGSDYAVHCTVDGRLVASSNFVAPVGEPAGTTRKLGGFHVLLTGEIAPYSLWDLAYRPACPDPRGMVKIGDSGFWADIYLLGTNHVVDGTSKAGATIADGASPPKKPLAFGGDGAAAYTDLTWYTAMDCLQSYGKRAPSWIEFSMLAFGVTEASSVGVDPVTTKLDAPRRSKWGVEQATGNMWIWGANVQSGAAGGAWAANTGGRGSVFSVDMSAVILGGTWYVGGSCGSRCAVWNNAPSASSDGIGARGVCDHLALQVER